MVLLFAAIIFPELTYLVILAILGLYEIGVEQTKTSITLDANGKGSLLTRQPTNVISPIPTPPGFTILDLSSGIHSPSDSIIAIILNETAPACRFAATRIDVAKSHDCTLPHFRGELGTLASCEVASRLPSLSARL